MVRWLPGKLKKREIARQEAKLKVRTNTFADKLNTRAHHTNETKKKNKPYMMVANKLKNKAVDLFEKIRKSKNKLGKVTNRGLKNKISNKHGGNGLRRKVRR